MKSTQLLSVVLSMILLLGVSAGPAFAQVEDDMDDDHMDDASIEEREDDDDDREDERDDDRDEEREDDDDDLKGDYDDDRDEDYDDLNEVHDDDRDDKHEDLDDRLEHFCDMTGEDKRKLFADHPRIEQFADRLANYCEMSEDERDDAIDKFIRENFPEEEHDDEYDLGDLLDRFCAATDEDKRKLFADRPILEQFRDRLANYCEMSEDEQDAVEDFLEKYKGQIKTAIREHVGDYKKDHAADFREKLENYCTMSDEDKKSYIAKHDKTEEHQTKMNKYCESNEDERKIFIKDNLETYKEHMKEMMMDKHHDMKLSEKSERLKAMIMTKYDISDERMDEIKEKYRKKYGDLDKKHSELKMKFKEHMKKMKHNISEERKSMIHDRIAEMKAFKDELRERAADMTSEEKQQLREEFIEKAKDMQLAWISPRIQIAAGVDASDVECREGYSLVMKASNGVAMCLKAETALKMIDRGIAVPAN